MQLSGDRRDYMIVACVATILTAASLFSVLSGPKFPTSHSQTWADFHIVVDLLMAAYVCVLFRKTTDKLERAAIIIFLVWTAESIARYMAESGLWAGFSQERYISTAFACVVTVLVDIRAYQVFCARARQPESD